MPLTDTRLLDVLVAHSHENIAIADPRGRLLAVSPGMPLIYGGRLEDYLGHDVFELESSGTLQPSVTRLVLERGHEVEVMQRTSVGRTVLARAFPVRGDDGAIARVISLSYDLTDLNQLRSQYERHLRETPRREPMTRIPALQHPAEGLLLESAASRAAFALVERVAETDASVLFLGESGVGKTQFARRVHAMSRRRGGRLVEVNCAAIPDNLLEAELFGHEAGAFTGAQAQGRPGLIETAHGGTLFLDEIGEAPPAMQAKLLKVLNDRRITRVGGRTERIVDFRLITATNRDLPAQVAGGGFRSDLYYRISVFPITIAPLRQRPEDLVALLDHVLDALARRYGVRKSLQRALQTRLLARAWPGNVRELENHLERLYLSSPGALIDTDPDEAIPLSAPSPTAAEADAPSAFPSLPAAIARLERELLAGARERCRSTYEMARQLGISQPTVVRKLREYGL